MGIDETPELEGKERLVVYIKKHRDKSHTRDSIVLFLVMQCPARAPYMREQSKLIENAKFIETRSMPLFPSFATCPDPDFKPVAQQTHPVIDSFLPKAYETTASNAPAMTTYNFGEKYEPLQSTGEPVQWTLYADIEETLRNTSRCEIDVEKLIVKPNMVLGRGGFGVTVPIGDKLVAKTNLFPEMVNWSLPFIDKEFNRYAHIASQVEEIMIGVSMKHPNILRTFGGFWCDIPGYQLGGRAVLIMERALYSLQEFMYRVQSKAFMPMIELDTLKGLEYLRSRTIQHRDLTYKNILVCHQPDRKPISFTFKISDFGTSCNFSTPDQPRGNRTNMAPEVLWCLNTATGSDIFSWYCVMWALHGDSSLVQHTASGKIYCKSTYAKNLSELVGVYNAERDNVFELNYMTAIGARELHVKHRDRRPNAEEISTKLQAMGRHIKDRYFVSMGMLCITLYPQERWSPSKLLSLPRYQRLSEDVDEAQCSPAQRLPLSVRVGEYRATDIIACEDSVPEELTKLTMDGATAGSPITVIETQQKEYYGIDLLRLAPVESSLTIGIPRRQPKSTPAVDDPGEGTSAKSAKQRVSSPARHLPTLRCDTTTHVRRVPDEELLAVRSSGDHVECDNASRGLQKIHGTQLNVGADVLIQEASQRQDRSTSADQVCKTVYKPRGTMILRSKSIKGELDTKIVILKGCDANEITHFKQNVISLSKTMTQQHPLIFAGPRGELCKCSRGNGVFIFQYGQLLEDCKPVAIWNESDSPNSVYSFLLQVLLTLKTASDAMLLPTHMCEWTDILISKGAVMIDTVSYLSKNYMKPQSSLFSDKCESLISLCTTLVAKHLPESELCQWLMKLNQSTVAYQVLTGSIQWLRNFDCSERRIPCLMSLDDNVVTFRDYSANLSNWLTNSGEERGEEAHKRSSSNTLVYGHPKPFRGNQTTESALDTKLDTLVRNIILRMRVKIFKSLKLKVSALDCTRGLTKLTLNNATLLGISSIDQLNPSSSSGFAHDAASKTESKWAPVIMFGKHKKQGPVQELTVESYTVTILVVLLSPNGSVKTLTELFQGVVMFSESDY
ncbi:Serine/threonine-protein kinase PLK4 [Collichthys lucidus]|uniref:Serine/threonine-protein kinase PLK4 n=1 Tax=Collichthys lucidus TaxID=240159 RepID=A0A4U5TWG8_COLLU|nr:Serine/threonine-protein kinase PLK4 [Collichthys lucidus]